MHTSTINQIQGYTATTSAQGLTSEDLSKKDLGLIQFQVEVKMGAFFIKFIKIFAWLNFNLTGQCFTPQLYFAQLQACKIQPDS